MKGSDSSLKIQMNSSNKTAKTIATRRSSSTSSGEKKKKSGKVVTRFIVRECTCPCPTAFSSS